MGRGFQYPKESGLACHHPAVTSIAFRCPLAIKYLSQGGESKLGFKY